MPSNPKYSVVVPLYNEEENIPKLDKEIKEVMNRLGSYETIYINDGSTDSSLQQLKRLKKATIIDLNRNYGQSTALDAGFRQAKGEIIITLDSDLQNDPRDIPLLLKKLNENNLDVVAGWRKNRKDKSSIRILTRIGRFFRSILLKDNVHDTGCTLRVYRSQAAKSLDLQGEMHRYILSLLRWKGFRIGEVEVNHRPRIHGQAKYGVSKSIRGFIDLIYIWFINKYSQRPLHGFGYLALFSAMFSVLSLMEAIGARFLWAHLPLNRNGFFYLAFFFGIATILFFSFGIALDLLIRIHLNTSPIERRYYVREVIKN